MLRAMRGWTSSLCGSSKLCADMSKTVRDKWHGLCYQTGICSACSHRDNALDLHRNLMHFLKQVCKNSFLTGDVLLQAQGQTIGMQFHALVAK